MGIAVIMQSLLHGRVTGISGMLSSVLLFPFSKKGADQKRSFIDNAVYLAGVLLAGFMLHGQFHLSDQQQTSNVLGPGILFHLFVGAIVGLGTSLGSGCSTGHLLCGIARLSKRSIVATATFCFTCGLIVQLNLSPALNALVVASNAPFITFPSMFQLLIIFALITVAILVNSFLFLRAANFKKLGNHDPLEHFSFFWNGITFGCGLAISGMVRPEKVLGFFSFGSPLYDPSLLCVAGLAILPSLLVFQFYVLPESKKPHTTSLYQREYCMPTANRITPALVIGAALFGIGWGLAGICPGPAVVNAGSLQAVAWSWIVGCALGAYFSKYVEPLLQ